MSEQHYKGSCQCGAVTFETDVDLDNTITCNCSRCQRLGSVLAFTPRAFRRLTQNSDAPAGMDAWMILDWLVPRRPKMRGAGLPSPASTAEALADAERRSPELLSARLQAERATAQVALARRERWPDLAVTAAIMPRGGLEPMWSAGVSVSASLFLTCRLVNAPLTSP